MALLLILSSKFAVYIAPGFDLLFHQEVKILWLGQKDLDSKSKQCAIAVRISESKSSCCAVVVAVSEWEHFVSNP